VNFPHAVRPAARRLVVSTRNHSVRLLSVLALLLLHNPGALAVPVATTTALAITAAGSPVTTVSAGTLVKLTATVSNLSTKVGLVKFCNAAATYCTDINLIGTAQVTSSGTASISLIPGKGNHSYKAIYVGTSTVVASTSGISTLAVTPLPSTPYSTTTSIAASGTTGNYTLTGTVIGTAGTTIPLTGSVTFPDTTNGNTSLGSATLGASKPGFNFTVNDYLEACGLNTGLVVADFNGDGIPDVASSCAVTSTVQVYLGTGGGNMGTPVGYTVDGPNSGGYTNLAVADFNGDGIPDIVDIDGGYNEVSVLLGNGNGTFATQKKTSVGSQPLAVAVGDFNGDGIPDLAVTSNNDSKLYILIGKGDGTFTVQATSYPTGSNPTGIVAGDFNNDGKLDLAVSNNGTNTIQIFLGNGDGTFTQTANPLITGNQPSTVIAADFNRDGKLDLATGNFADNTVTIFLGNGDGTFTASTIPTMPDGVTPIFDRNSSLAAADFNGDGIPDLAVVNYSYVNSAQNSSAILYGNGDGTFTFAGFATINNNSQGWPGQQDNPDLVVAADMNGDGIPDVVMVDSNYNVALTIDTITAITATATATLNNVAPQGLGTHNVEASYAGDTHYASSLSSTTALNGSATTKVASTLTGPTVQPVFITSGTTGSFYVTVSGSAGSAPSGSVGYTIGSPCAASCTGTAVIASGIASVPVSGTLAPGGYTVAITYAGDTNYTAATPISVSIQIGLLTPTVNAGLNNATATFGTNLSAFLVATTSYNSTSLTTGGATTYTAKLGTGSPVTVTATTVLTPGLYTLTATWTPNSTNAAIYNSASGSGQLTITPAGSTATIAQTAPLPATVGAGIGVPITLKATVASAVVGLSTVPTGTVQFYNGAVALGSPSTITAGAATLTTTFTTVQTASITAVYSGDANFTATTSAVFTESVIAQGLAVTATPTTLTITRGTVASATITFTPTGNYQGTATYSCSGLPAFSSCIFTPTTLTFTGNNAVQTSALQIYTIAPYAAPSPAKSGLLWIPAMLLVTLLIFRRSKLAPATRALLLAVMACAAFGIMGCGNGAYWTPAGADTVTVNVTAAAAPGSSSPNLNPTATISITIQ